jgi:hypothetical protein
MHSANLRLSQRRYSGILTVMTVGEVRSFMSGSWALWLAILLWAGSSVVGQLTIRDQDKLIHAQNNTIRALGAEMMQVQGKLTNCTLLNEEREWQGEKRRRLLMTEAQD